MWSECVGGTACAAAGVLAYGVRGRTARLFGPSVWRGDAGRRSIALTFDDGPSESTPELLELLARHGVRATFFECGRHVRRLPQVARAVAGAGHELGNHSDTHRAFYFLPAREIHAELARAQEAIGEAAGVKPVLFRAPFGTRWFGLRAAQRSLGLLGVMWTAIGRDWKLPAARVAGRLARAASNGAIFCLHDGRGLTPAPDIRATLEAVRRLIPVLQDQGYQF
ncbi:MAG TPA: polysaccharide deacetylase family protein, partial [Bryobacteraceae bacterium]|nr:polysaccharide deacetylase family protein [Bryobacteraceae bacterium]